MNKISAKIVADSISSQGHRITSYILTYPRFIHAELMTHRMFSRNSASSRAIPFEKMVKMVEEDPFIPIAWQKDHKGMQGTEYINPHTDFNCAPISDWLAAKDSAVETAKEMNADGITKQLCNRLLEPFMWHTVLVTATEWDNFFELRCPKYKLLGYKGEELFFKSKKDALKYFEGIGDEIEQYTYLDWIKISESGAEIHIQALAEAMWDAMKESTPNQLNSEEWHMPFMGNFDAKELLKISGIQPEDFELVCRKIATARAARLSYMTFDGEIDYEKDIKLHDQLLESNHMSPFEHCARVMNEYEFHNFTKGFPSKDGIGSFVQTGWCNNFRGFIPYRYLVENESKKC